MKGKSYRRFKYIAPFYDMAVKVMGIALGGEGAVRRTVLDLLPLSQGGRVLEIGCGTGTVTLMAARRVGTGGLVIGVDPSGEMLARAQRKTTARYPQVEFHNIGGAPLPFADDSFDAVIFFLALHEMEHEDRIESLREALRVLKMGGYLLVGELHRPHSCAAGVVLRLLLLVEEQEATDFLRRGLSEIVQEACGSSFVERICLLFAAELGQGRLYQKELDGAPLIAANHRCPVSTRTRVQQMVGAQGRKNARNNRGGKS